MPDLARQNGMPVVALSIDRYNQTTSEQVMHTIKTNAQTGDGGPCVCHSVGVENNTPKMGDAARTITGDHNDPLTTRIYGTGGANPTLQNGGTGGTIRQGVCISLDGDKIGKAERAGGSGLGVNTDDGYTETAKDVHAVAIGFKAGQSANGGLGDEREVSPTMSHLPSALEPTVAIGINSPQPHSTTRGFGEDVQPTFGAAAGESGNNKPMVAVAVGCDRRNQSGADEVQPALQSTVSDGGSTVAVGCDMYNMATTGDVGQTIASAAADCNHMPTISPNHIVRRLTVVECSRLQGFPDWWVRIPVDKWRKIDRDEYDYLAGLGAWYRSHIRETGKPGVWETDLSSDSPAYKALGNSWATNCAEWILRRIVAAIRLGRI